MDCLPQEILDLIVDHLHHAWRLNGKQKSDGLFTLASVNLGWQHAIERRLFRHLKIPTYELPALKLMLNTRRCGYLFELRYCLRDVPGLVCIDATPSDYLQADLAKWNAYVESEMRRVLTFIKESIDPKMCNPRFRLKIDLELHTVKSSIEPEHHNVFIPGGGARISIVDSQFAFFMPRYPFFEPAPQVRVSSWEALPVATSVTSLTVATPLDARPGDGEERLCYSNGVLDPQVIPMIFSSAPQAEEVQIEVYEMSKSYDARDYGQQLENVARALPTLTLQNLRSLRLTFLSYTRGWTTQDGYIQHARSISFNKALGRLAKKLKNIELLDGFFLTPEFFQPDADKDYPNQTWKIQTLVIDAHPGSTQKGSMEYDPFKTPEEDPAKLGPLAVAMTKAMLRMPKLKLLVVQLGVRNSKPDCIGSWIRDEGTFKFKRDEWETGRQCRGLEGLFHDRKMRPCSWVPPDEAVRNWTEFRGSLDAVLTEERLGRTWCTVGLAAWSSQVDLLRL